MSTTFDVILTTFCDRLRPRRRASLIEFWCFIKDCFSASAASLCGMTNNLHKSRTRKQPAKREGERKIKAGRQGNCNSALYNSVFISFETSFRFPNSPCTPTTRFYFFALLSRFSNVNIKLSLIFKINNNIHSNLIMSPVKQASKDDDEEDDLTWRFFNFVFATFFLFEDDGTGRKIWINYSNRTENRNLFSSWNNCQG